MTFSGHIRSLYLKNYQTDLDGSRIRCSPRARKGRQEVPPLRGERRADKIERWGRI